MTLPVLRCTGNSDAAGGVTLVMSAQQVVSIGPGRDAVSVGKLRSPSLPGPGLGPDSDSSLCSGA